MATENDRGGRQRPARVWRSSLYPESWRPADRDERGRFLHDFSYAGYHRGERRIPDEPAGRVVDVTRPPYSADPTGAQNATAALQRALDAVGTDGGGVVHLPAGTYRVRPPAGASCALHIRHSGVVLRGDGPDATRLFNDEPAMRDRSVVRMAPASGGGVWYGLEERPLALRADLPAPTREVPVGDTSGYNVGDWVVVRLDATEAWIAEHHMTGKWTPERMRGPTLYRRIVGIHLTEGGAGGTFVLDAPTRYPLRRRDGARVYKVPPHLCEVGVEGLAIGMRETTAPGLEEHDYLREGTGGHAAHGSWAVLVSHVADGWVRHVGSYRPPENDGDVQLLSNGILLSQAACVTVARCALARPQYRGGGGNGYLYALGGNDCLVVECAATGGRHNVCFRGPQTSGNVLLRLVLRDGLHASDFHMQLSVANLVDSPSLDREYLEAAYRPYGGIEHGQTTSQSVFWNVRGERPYPHMRLPVAVISQQFGWGYLIGTSGPCSGVTVPSGSGTEPVDHVEGLGEGEGLVPRSLYEDQLSHRLDRPRGSM